MGDEAELIALGILEDDETIGGSIIQDVCAKVEQPLELRVEVVDP